MTVAAIRRALAGCTPGRGLNYITCLQSNTGRKFALSETATGLPRCLWPRVQTTNLVISSGLVMGTPAQAEEERAIRTYRIEQLLRIRCPFCGAPAGELCRTEAGREILSIGSMHLARITPTRVNERYRRFR